MPDFFRERQWDLVGPKRRLIWFGISLVTIAIGLAFLSTKGLNYGIDFTGGGLLTYRLAEPISSGQENTTLAQVRQAVAEAGITRSQIQLASGKTLAKDELLIRTQAKSTDEVKEQDEKIQKSLKALPAFQDITREGIEKVSAVVSKELIQRALLAVALGAIVLLGYIVIRYDFKFAVCAIIALIHDILVLVGAFAILQEEVNSPFVAAILTVVGYSVHDTIVIFDRFRENLRLRKFPTFSETANRSLLQTMARSINTVLTVLFTLLALFFFGGSNLRGFALALLVGIISGAYSSIFNASQILVAWKEREERAKATRAAKAVTARATRPAPTAARTPRPAAVPAAVGERGQPSSAAPSQATHGVAESSPANSVAASGERRRQKTKRKRRRF